MWIGQIEPAEHLKAINFPDVVKHLSVPIFSGHKADISVFSGASPEFDAHISANNTIKEGYEDQCTALHYFDLFNSAIKFKSNHIVDVGVYLGGSSVTLAGVAAFTGATLDLVDINENFLRASFERIRRTYPDIISRIRLFHGTFPNYVLNVMLKNKISTYVHFDGSHEFYDVVDDLSSLYFIKDYVDAVAIQDTHLRGVQYRNFVDAAVAAVFGLDVNYYGIGSKFVKGKHDEMLVPNKYQGNYMLPDRYEGMVIDFSDVSFLYPHPSMTMEAMLKYER